ncbi:iron complex transport system substrate-binding protein [Scopulibacillus darangshiensis]|uniref:Iron complex transport system substrate-binding protein n=1 Tax=Scopulibacillus darangshiensis TaxID=442528 RepID=A0A4R2P8I9_9BACL|nr:ABC transporter substrate-binding protein [Scopulibacillus darangshiensis]TCP31252.1 iron complex transport system substrate-binding protein [Scopulibacillus darangshiensis]
MKKRLWLLPIFLIILVLAACGGQKTEGQSDKKAESQKHAEQSKQEFPVTVTDANGKKLTIKEKPKRIVSLIPSNTETAFALGLGKKIVGVSDYDNYPKAAASKEKVGGKDINIEKVVSLKPDLVLATASNAHNSSAGLKQLRQAGIEVLVVNDAASFADVYKSIHLIAKATGTGKKAKEIIDGMKEKVAEIKVKADKIPKQDRVKVWIEVSAPPNIFTAGSGTFMDEMLDIINAKNIAAEKKGWVKYSGESVVKANPDVIVLTYGYYVKGAVKQVYNRSGWSGVSAVKNKRVYNVESDLVSRSGPRLAEGLEKMAEAVYPDVFKK